MIPLLLIPQMILSGLLFSFDKLNNLISTKGKVPIVADLMASRWAYEAMVVHQFIYNDYETPYYNYEKEVAKADFKASYLADELKRRNRWVLDNLAGKTDSLRGLVAKELIVLRDEFRGEPFRQGIEKINLEEELSPGKYSTAFGEMLENYIEQYRKYYQRIYNESVSLIEKKMAFYEKQGFRVNQEKNRYFNESLSDLVKNANTKNRWIEYNGEIIQQINPIFQETQPKRLLDYRTQFFAPKKNLFGISVNTFLFNVLVIWAMTIVFYVTLYFELAKKLVDSFGKVNFPNRK